MADHISITTPVHGSPSRISWGSVIGGAVIVIALMCCLSDMVLALGISFLRPQDPGSDHAIPTIALTGALAWVVTALVSLFAGGWAAAHLARQANETDSVLHGLLVWGLGMALMAMIAASAAGMAVGGAFSLVSSGLAAAGSAAGGLARAGAAVAQGRQPGDAPAVPAFNWDAIKYQAQNLLQESRSAVRPKEAGQESAAAATGQAHPAPPAAGSDGLALLGRLFSAPGATLSESDRATAVSMLTATTSLSREAAEKQIRDWERIAADATRTYEGLKAEAAQKARATAAAAAKALADAAWIAFVAAVLGASAAMLGGYVGGWQTRRATIIHPQANPASTAVLT